MPLLKYFVTVGAILISLLISVSSMLEPSKPKSTKSATAGIERNIATPRTTTGAAPGAPVAMAPRAATEQEPPSASGATRAQSAQDSQLTTGQVEQNASIPAMPKGKTAQKRAKSRNSNVKPSNLRDDPRSSAYAQEKPAWRSSPEGTLGPH